ncbi:MAG: hypothetical protein ACOC7T_01700 [Planctomycetota bacterium]
MRAGRRALIACLLAAALAAGAGGCTVAPRYERGERLRTESRVADRAPQYELRALRRLDAPSPHLLVWVDVREKVTEEWRPVYRKVEVTGRRRPSFEPEFFLWPWNAVRTPVGLTGAAFSTVDWLSHYVAAGAGAAVGLVSTSISYSYLKTAGALGLVQMTPTTGYETSGALTQVAVAVLETPLLLLDWPHGLLHGTPVYPVFRNRDEFPGGWLEAIGDSWRFAWDWTAYPPFFIWYRTDLTRRELPDQVIRGGLRRREEFTDWRPAEVSKYRVSGPRLDRALPGGGLVRIELSELRSLQRPSGPLRFTLTAHTAGGPVSRRFTVPPVGPEAAPAD